MSEQRRKSLYDVLSESAENMGASALNTAITATIETIDNDREIQVLDIPGIGPF
jgi:hypothetical protein